MTDDAMAERTVYHVSLTASGGYQFLATFEDLEDRMPLLLDEPPPLGEGHGPSAPTLLAAAVGHCLSAALLLCLRKTRAEVGGLTAQVAVHLAPGGTGRLHVERLSVELRPEVAPPDADRLARCQRLFEEFCVLTESLRRGIPVDVTVVPPASTTSPPAAQVD